MVILKLGDLATFIHGNCRKSATFQSNKRMEIFVEEIFIGKGIIKGEEAMYNQLTE